MSFDPTHPGTVILRDSPPGGASRWLLFANPVHVLTADTPAEVVPLLQRIEEATARGLTAAGYLAYETAPAFDPANRTRDPDAPHRRPPLAWFGLYAAATPLDALPASTQAPPRLEWTPAESLPDYTRRFDRIRNHIAEGDVYQVNYTFRLHAPFDGDPWPLFLALEAAQQCRYAAWIRLENYAICSASPELFFRRDGDRIVCRPMKGTAARGPTATEDRAARSRLRQSAKDQAENVMIVDMLRNDLGRIARPGSVTVPRRFTIEPYPTVWQMTSDVEARTDAALTDLFAALFPCASISGAPKIRALSLIAALETSPRGIYTGAIGYAAPGGHAQFNVAIRTVTVDHVRACAAYGTGGGIVWDSRAGKEYAEALAKSGVLAAPPADMQLFETLLWRPGRGWFLLRGHLHRLANSARRLGFPCDAAAIRRALDTAVAGAVSPLRVKLLLPRSGAPTVETAPAPAPSTPPWRVTLALAPVNPADPWLGHKTTNRRLYEAARATCPGFDDVLLWNTRGELTESTIANLALRLGGCWYTPPLACGLLPGVYRAHLLRLGRIVERRLTLGDFDRAEGVALFNSLRGWIDVDVVVPPSAS